MARGRKASPVLVIQIAKSPWEKARDVEIDFDKSEEDKLQKVYNPKERTLSAAAKGTLNYSELDVVFARSTSYDSMDKYFREFKRDSLARQCTILKAGWTTKEGFKTELDWVNPATKGGNLATFNPIKDYVDNTNRIVDLDGILRNAVIFMQVSGIATYYILEEDDDVKALIELEPWNMTPRLNEDGTLKSWKYTGVKIEFELEGYESNELPPECIFYITNSAVLNEHVGLSDIEPIIETLASRRYLLQEAIQESAKSLWAPSGFLSFDTGKQKEAQAKTTIATIIDNTTLSPGRLYGINQDLKFTQVNISPDLQKLVAAKDDLDREIIGNFEVPAALLSRSTQAGGLSIGSEEAKTTAKMFINGPIADMQKRVGRQVEARWYDFLIRKFMVKTKTLKEGQAPPIKLKHIWNPNSISEEHESEPEAKSVPPPATETNEEKNARMLKASVDIEVSKAKKELYAELLKGIRDLR